MLQLRNTPDPDCNVSPAQIIFGRPIRDAFSFTNRLEKFSNPSVSPLWREAWASKEAALRTRFTRTSESLNEHVKALPPLSIGDRCFIQNQTGIAPKKWDRTGLVTEVLDHDQYMVKVDGSGRVTRRNRRFLRAFKPATTASEVAPPRMSCPSHDKLLVTPPPAPPLDVFTPQNMPDTAQPEFRCPTQTPPPSTERSGENTSRPPSPSASDSATVTPTMPGTPLNQTRRGEDCSKIPRALKRLMPHNKPGLKETAPPQWRQWPVERP